MLKRRHEEPHDPKVPQPLIAHISFLYVRKKQYGYTPASGWDGRESEEVQSAKIRLGADCSSDYELLLIAKFRLKLKKMGKTAKPFRYDLNQIPSDYTVEVRNIF